MLPLVRFQQYVSFFYNDSCLVTSVEHLDKTFQHKLCFIQLWKFLIEDLKSLGAKKFFGKFATGSINHINIRSLQVHFRSLQVHFRSLQVHFRSLQVHFRSLQVHFRSLQIHFLSLQVHFGPFRYTSLPSGTLRYLQVHTCGLFR